MTNIRMVPAARTSRTPRSPKHTFYVKHRPYQIQPFFIAPVLPGETMKNLLMQSRAVTDPILNPLMGWWLEHYFFYVKHRDLPERDLLTEMMVNPEVDLSSLNTVAASTDFYTHANTIAWTEKCVKRITDVYFRDEGETWATALIGNLPAASINMETGLQSLITDAAYTVPDLDVDGPDGNTTIQASEIDAAMRAYQFLQANRLTDMSYEDYLRTYGIRTPKAEMHEPELIRYSREWTYPSNTVNPATGVPASAASWAVSMRADKDRFFKEPGFLVGLTVARPKVYLSKQTGSLVGTMKDAVSWLPAVMNDDPFSSVRKWATGAGPLKDATGAYWFDVKDLLMYGDQFTNVAMTDLGVNLIGLPENTLANKRYPSAAMADLMFVTPAGSNFIRQDGIVDLTILGNTIDSTPMTEVA